MSDFRSQEAGATNPRGFTLVARASGNPITTGTVNWYLKNISGANAGKWWRDSDQTWQVAETANAMTHQADGHWTRTLAATPWIDADINLEYAKESGDLHVPVSRTLKVEYTPTADSSRRVDVSKVAGTAQTARDLGGTLGVAGAGLTALGDTRIANLDATISSRTKPADTQARVTLVDTVTTNTDMLAAAGVRSAVGLATANLDTQLSGINSKTTNLPAAPASTTNITAGTITTATNVTNDVGITQAGADKVWASAARTLTGFGTLVADVATAVWAAVTRTITGGSLTTPAPTAVAIRQEIDTNSTQLAAIKAKTDLIISLPVATVTGTPTTSVVTVTGLADTTANAYKDAYALFLTGANAFSAPFPILTSTYSGGITTLTFTGLLVAPAAADTLVTLGSKKSS